MEGDAGGVISLDLRFSQKPLAPCRSSFQAPKIEIPGQKDHNDYDISGKEQKNGNSIIDNGDQEDGDPNEEAQLDLTGRLSLRRHAEDPRKHNWITSLLSPISCVVMICKMQVKQVATCVRTQASAHYLMGLHHVLRAKLHREVTWNPNLDLRVFFSKVKRRKRGEYYAIANKNAEEANSDLHARMTIQSSEQISKTKFSTKLSGKLSTRLLNHSPARPLSGDVTTDAKLDSSLKARGDQIYDLYSGRTVSTLVKTSSYCNALVSVRSLAGESQQYGQWDDDELIGGKHPLYAATDAEIVNYTETNPLYIFHDRSTGVHRMFSMKWRCDHNQTDASHNADSPPGPFSIPSTPNRFSLTSSENPVEHCSMNIGQMCYGAGEKNEYVSDSYATSQTTTNHVRNERNRSQQNGLPMLLNASPNSSDEGSSKVGRESFYPKSYIETQSKKSQANLAHIRANSTFHPNMACDCIRCFMHQLDSRRNTKDLNHNYSYNSCMLALQFTTKSFLLNETITPYLRKIADIKMPTLIVPFQRTSRGSCSIPARDPDVILAEYFGNDLETLKKEIREKREKKGNNVLKDGQEKSPFSTDAKPKVNRGSEAGIKHIKCEWLWPNHLTPHLSGAFSNNKEFEHEEEYASSDEENEEYTSEPQNDPPEPQDGAANADGISASVDGTTQTHYNDPSEVLVETTLLATTSVGHVGTCVGSPDKTNDVSQSQVAAALNLNSPSGTSSASTIAASGTAAGFTGSVDPKEYRKRSTKGSPQSLATEEGRRKRFLRFSKKPSWVIEKDPGFQRALQNPNQRVIYFIHGGGYVLCTTQTHRGVIYNLVDKTGYMLFTPNYRRPPDVDILVTIDDCLRGYFHLIDTLNIDPWRISLVGDSAGAGLCMQVLQILKRNMEVRARELERQLAKDFVAETLTEMPELKSSNSTSADVGPQADYQAISKCRHLAWKGATWQGMEVDFIPTGTFDNRKSGRHSTESMQTTLSEVNSGKRNTTNDVFDRTSIMPTDPMSSCTVHRSSLPSVSGNRTSITMRKKSSTDAIRRGESGRGSSRNFGSIRAFQSILPRNVVFISPWVDCTSSEKTDASYVINGKTDIFRPEGVKRFCNIVSAGSVSFDRLSSPLVSPTYHKDLSNLPPVLVTAGEQELFRDQIVEFACKLKRVNRCVEFEVYHDMSHVFPIFFPVHPTPRRGFESVTRFLVSAD